MEQFLPPATLRSGWSTSIPVSMTATSTFTFPEPFPETVPLRGPSMRLMPVGVTCAATATRRSATTERTFGFRASEAAACSEASNEKPRRACS